MDNRGQGIYTTMSHNGVLGTYTIPVPCNTPTDVQALAIMQAPDDFWR
jgi:hypothetical protein